MPKLDKRHYVPAALIGHFSATPNVDRLRRSQVAVHRFTPPADFATSAENVGHSRDLYRGASAESLDNDRYFSGFEKFSQEPVSHIIAGVSGALPADDWVKTAAYITSQFTRSPDLERSLGELSQTSGWPRERMDVGYALNTQRVSSAVLRARWEFVRTRKNLILNDRALAPVQFGDWGMRGYFIPLRKHFGVRIADGPHEKQLTWVDGEWRIDVPIVDIADEQVDMLNCWTWCGAVDEVYGSSAKLLAEIESQTVRMKQDLPNLAKYIDGAGLLGLSAEQRRNDEMLLLSLLGGIESPADGDEVPRLAV